MFEGAYHGRSIYTSQLSASHRYRAAAPQLGVQVMRLPYPDCQACRFGYKPETCHAECLEFSRASLMNDYAGVLTRGDGPAVSALLIEPMLNVAGMVFPDPRYLNGIVREFQARGALVIADEVFSGFYRTGPALAFQHYNFVPDIIVVSKALTNGLAPLSCVWAREPLLSPDCFPPGTHSVTFANNPLSFAIVETVLDRFERWPSIAADIAVLERKLQSAIGIAAASPLVAGFEVRGATARIALRGPSADQVRETAARIGRESPIDGYYGLLLASTGMAPSTVAMHPPLAIDDEGLGQLGRLLARTFQSLEGDRDERG